MPDFSEYAKIQMKDLDVQRFGFDKEVSGAADIGFLSKKYGYKKDDQINFMGIIKDAEDKYSTYELSFKYGLSPSMIEDIVGGKMEDGFIPSKKYLKKEAAEKLKRGIPAPLAEKYFFAESDAYKSSRYMDGSKAVKLLDDLVNKKYLGGTTSTTQLSHSGLVDRLGLSLANSMASKKSFPIVKRKKTGNHNMYSIKSIEEYEAFHKEYRAVSKKEIFPETDSDLIPYIVKKILPEGNIIMSPKKTMFLKLSEEAITRDIIAKQQ